MIIFILGPSLRKQQSWFIMLTLRLLNRIQTESVDGHDFFKITCFESKLSIFNGECRKRMLVNS